MQRRALQCGVLCGWGAAFILVFGFFANLGSWSMARATTEQASEQAIRIQQEALVWTTDYEGIIDGKAGEQTTEAIKKFQVGLGHAATGKLSDDEVVTLIKIGFAKRDSFKFSQYVDRVAGVSVGIPSKLLPAGTTTKDWGSSWYSKENGIAIDTLRLRDSSLANLYQKLLSINNRTISYTRYVDDNWFVIAAFEGKAAIYIRAALVRLTGKPDEIRGFSIWMSEDRPKAYQSFAPAMLSSFRFNTDTTGDVSILPSGGPDNVVMKEYKRFDYGYQKRTEPPVPLVSPNPKPASLGTCFYGLGDCPISMFAFRP